MYAMPDTKVKHTVKAYRLKRTDHGSANSENKSAVIWTTVVTLLTHKG